MPVVRELGVAPNLTVLFGKALLGSRRKRGGPLPSTAYRLDGVLADPAHLSAYQRLCGFRPTGELPITYPHVLSFPLQVKLMTDGDFPFPLIGSVHLANRITRYRPLRADRPLRIQVHAANLRDHPRGRQFDVVTEVFAGTSQVWHGVSTYLRRLGSSGSGGSGAERATVARPAHAVWPVPADIGRRYAAVSGDRNPIHLYAVTATLFGFRRAIAHGMWTTARCVAAFDERLPDECTVDVRFTAPVLLPARVGFTTEHQPDGWSFELFDAESGRPHLTGTMAGPAPARE